ncbi:MAG: M48 family metalloprotease [Oceanicoccus sp.]
MRNRVLTSLLLIAVGWLLVPATSFSQPNDKIQLPVLGDTVSSTFSLGREHELGQAWLRMFRNQVNIVSDALLQDYVEYLVYDLATASELKDRRLAIVVVNNRSINAFAVPGGVIGVHNGLILQAETEAQFASVVAHELAHLSQRHFARRLEAQQRSTIPSLVGLFAGIVLAATAGGESGMAAIMATQAATMQNQLRYSRLHETEADRGGMQTMVKADMDPAAAAGMFEIMQRTARYAGNRPPEFLMSHPVTESRISDARNRSRQYPRKMYADNLDYQLMRARVELGFIENSKDAVKRFRAKIEANSQSLDADQYGLVLALTINGEFDEAQQLLTPLQNASPNKICYTVAQAELEMARGDNNKAISLLNDALSIVPGNHPLTMTMVKAQLAANQPHTAEQLLQEHAKRKPNDPSVWYLLAETHGLAGNIIGVHKARAEYFLLIGVLDIAAKQLSYALPLVKNDHLETIRIRERIAQIERMKVDMANI